MALISHYIFHIEAKYTIEISNKIESYLQEELATAFKLYLSSTPKIRIEVEPGSIRIYAVTLAALSSLYVGIGLYGSFRSGIDYIIADSKSIFSIVTRNFQKAGIQPQSIKERRKVEATPEKLRRLYLKIDDLDRNYSNCSKDENRKKIGNIKEYLLKILYSIDDQEDIELLKYNIGSKHISGTEFLEVYSVKYGYTNNLPYEKNNPSQYLKNYERLFFRDEEELLKIEDSRNKKKGKT